MVEWTDLITYRLAPLYSVVVYSVLHVSSSECMYEGCVLIGENPVNIMPTMADIILYIIIITAFLTKP